MTTDEWLEIVNWVGDRFKPWTVDQATAYGIDLKSYNPEDVWDALYRLYDRGLEFAPNGSQLRKETTVVVRERLERARYESRGLPPSAAEDQRWGAWRDRLGYTNMSFGEAVETRHRELFPKGCLFSGCGWCGNIVEITTQLV